MNTATQFAPMKKMNKVIDNIKITDNFYLLKTDGVKNTIHGQFYMLRDWDKYPVLSRPISIFNVGEHLEFLYQVVGKGTEILKNLKKGSPINVYGPYGNGFDINVDSLAMVGGGVGVAPFYYLSKKILEKNKDAKLRLYLGEREGQNLESLFSDLPIDIKVKKGGFVTDIIDFDKHKLYYACGPEIMMKKTHELCRANNKNSYISLDLRMGCGLGACLSCSVDTKNGRKRSCKDGPVFMGSDIYE